MPDELLRIHELLRIRIVIEQAKGVVAERTGLDIADAFAWLCEHAGSRNLAVAEAAQAIVDSTARP